MSVWDELKSEMLKRTPHVKTLPWLDRLVVWLLVREDGEFSQTIENDRGQFRQSAVTKRYQGEDYIVRWGSLT